MHISKRSKRAKVDAVVQGGRERRREQSPMRETRKGGREVYGLRELEKPIEREIEPTR